jgi:hypothetical protein
MLAMSKRRHNSYHELREALAGPGCALCALTHRGVQRYLDGLTYENVNDPAIRERIRVARGFCAPHAQQLHAARSALGSAIIYRDVLVAVRRALEDASPNGSLGARLRQAIGGTEAGAALEAHGPCPACVYAEDIARTATDLLLRHLDDDELLAAVGASAGLCLPHLRLALRRAPDATRFARLREGQLSAWQRLEAELDELIRKHDYRYAQEAVGDEGNSWARAIDLLSGLPGT